MIVALATLDTRTVLRIEQPSRSILRAMTAFWSSTFVRPNRFGLACCTNVSCWQCWAIMRTFPRPGRLAKIENQTSDCRFGDATPMTLPAQI
jgi:hypothetical protein